MTTTTINCRSRESSHCYHGRPEQDVYEGDQTEDGTWDGQSVICDACYVALGQPSRGDVRFRTGKRRPDVGETHMSTQDVILRLQSGLSMLDADDSQTVELSREGLAEVLGLAIAKLGELEGIERAFQLFELHGIELDLRPPQGQ